MSSEKLWTPSPKPTDYGFENGLQVAEIKTGKDYTTCYTGRYASLG